MKKYIIIIIVTIITSVSFGQTIKRQANESVETFIKRLKPDTVELAHSIIETKIWNTSNKAIIAFYGYDDTSDLNIGFNKIFGHLYLPTGNNIYRDISFGPIEEDGGYPKIISVFFANADTDRPKELIVLCKYEQHHYDYGGQFYETFIFDNPSDKNKLLYFEKLSEKFWGCECSWRNGKIEVAKYKTAKNVKIRLKKMGYK